MKRKIYILSAILLSIYIMPSGILASESEELNNSNNVAEENVWIEVETSEELQTTADAMGMDVITYEYYEGLDVTNLNADGSIEQSVKCATYFVPENTVTLKASGSKYEEDPIVYYAAKAYSTITYDRYVKSNITYVKLTKVSGGVKNLDTGWRVVKQKVMYACTGAFDGNPLATQREEKNTTNMTFSYNCPSSWKGVNAQGAWRLVGLATDVTLQHGNGAKYTTNVTNHY